MHLRLFSVCVLVAPVAAQTTHIVDAFGAPGTFATLQAAVAAANDGDVIRVMPTGTYNFELTTGKGLTVIGEGAGAQFVGRLEVAGLPASQQFVLRNFRFAPTWTLPNCVLAVTNCAGSVLLEDVRAYAWSVYGYGERPALAVSNSAQVAVHRSAFVGYPGARIAGSTVAFDHTSIVGENGSYTGETNASRGLFTSGSTVFLTDCAIVGGDYWGGSELGTGEPGLQMNSSQVRLAGGSITAGVLTMWGNVGSAVVASGGSLVFDSEVQVAPGHPITGVIPTIEETGRVTFTRGAPGQTTCAGFDGPVGGYGVLAWAMCAAPIPTVYGSLWMDPFNLEILAAGPLPLQVCMTVPLLGVPSDVVTMQGFLVEPQPWRLSNPVRSALR